MTDIATMAIIPATALHAGEPMTGVEYLGRVLLTVLGLGTIAAVLYCLTDLVACIGARRLIRRTQESNR